MQLCVHVQNKSPKEIVYKSILIILKRTYEHLHSTVLLLSIKAVPLFAADIALIVMLHTLSCVLWRTAYCVGAYCIPLQT